VAIPDFQTLMLPVLRRAADGSIKAVSEVVEELADQFRLSPHERDQLVPSGQQRIFANRVSWSVSYLKRAELLKGAGRGKFQITPTGSGLAANPPDRITVRFLTENFEEFRSAQGRKREKQAARREPPVDVDEAATPEERMGAAHASLRQAVEDEILERVKDASPEFFERVVLRLLVAMGYGGSLADAAQHLGRSGDDGVDGVINEDRLGLEVVHVQAKRWKDAPVRRPDVQSFAGSLEGQRSRKGVFITTSHFTKDALEYVQRIEKRIVLIDGDELARLMVEHSVGVTAVATYPVFRVDETFFEET
jgi:restriction system protein